MMENFKTSNPRLFFLLVAVFFAILTTSGKAEEATTNQNVPLNAGNNAPLPGSLPFAKPVGGNNAQQSPLGYQQQQDPNNPQETINQPLSGFSQPYASTNQPNSGFNQNQPFNTINQPFRGTTNPRGSMENADFYNGVTKDKSITRGVVVLVSLVTFMVCFGF